MGESGRRIDGSSRRERPDRKFTTPLLLYPDLVQAGSKDSIQHPLLNIPFCSSAQQTPGKTSIYAEKVISRIQEQIRANAEGYKI
jgi:hypothetical protein